MIVIVPDVGHGNCVSISDGDVSLTVDCGAETDDKARNFFKFVNPELENSKKRELIITHYHFDHYNLLKGIPTNFFEKVYLPALPPDRTTSMAFCESFAIFFILQFKGYPLIPEILRVARTIVPLVKNDSFRTLNRDWEVLWPDYGIIDKRNMKSINNLQKEIEKIKEKLDRESLEEFERWYRIFSRVFSEGGKFDYTKLVDENHIKLNIKNNNPKIVELLERLEKVFKRLANRASLVTREIQGDFLFTGDIDTTILDEHLNFSDIEYFLVETPHHGGFYGRAFNNLKTEVLVISRNARYMPRPEFFSYIDWRIFVDTGRQGSCIVEKSSGLPYGVHTITIKSKEAFAHFFMLLLS